MKTATIPLVTSYLSTVRDRALLRYSLWIADDGKCYICDNIKPLNDIQIDHVLPKRLTEKEFNTLWAQHSHGLPNNGVHDISNLRAACRDCNSSRRKGSIVLSPTILDTHLSKSATIIAKAHAAQTRMRQNSAIGESIVHLTTARTPAEYDILWDDTLNQALLDTLHTASRTITTRARRRDVWTSEFFIEVQTDQETQLRLAALQLISAVSMDELLDGVTGVAAQEISDRYSRFVKMYYDDLRGADPSPIDWSFLTFSVVIDRVSLADDDWRCEATVSINTVVSALVSVQSEDGSKLVDEQRDGSVDAEIYVEVEVGQGGFDAEVIGGSVEFYPV